MEKESGYISYYSKAKLMLTGEYLVLLGAESLSLPLKPGQLLEVKSSNGISSIKWKSYEKSRFWFEAHFSLPEMAIANTNDFQIAKNLRDILIAARVLNPDFLPPGKHYEVRSNIEFELKWGIGSSSSLIANIAKWAGVDAFKLNEEVSEGSGYDIATAIATGPIVYMLGEKGPRYRRVDFDPVFKENLYFVYLGEKKDTGDAIRDFKKQELHLSHEVSEISEITRKLLDVSSLEGFVRLLDDHERIVGKLINRTPIKKKRFYDFNGFVKSLGAWGGDFALFASDYPKEYVAAYLKRKNLNTWFLYKDLVNNSAAYLNV